MGLSQLACYDSKAMGSSPGTFGAGTRPLPPEPSAAQQQNSLRPPTPRESSVVVDPLSQIPDAPRHSAGPRKRQSEATLVLRGRRADALRDKAAAEHVRTERLKKAKLAGFVFAAVVALGGGAYLARLSSAPSSEVASEAPERDAAALADIAATRDAAAASADAARDTTAPSDAAVPPDTVLPSDTTAQAAPRLQEEAAAPVAGARRADGPAASPPNVGESASASASGANARKGDAAASARSERSGSDQPAEPGVLTLDQLPTAD